MIRYLLFLLMVQNLMAYSESPYKIIYQTDTYEIRYYEERLIVETQYLNQNNGFQKLFNYISGNNYQSKKIEMTTPVNVIKIENQFVMQFYLPERYQKNDIPLPSDKSLKISTIEKGYFAVLRYSGFASEKNFRKHRDILKSELNSNNIRILGSAIKATYDGPFTLPNLRRNEAIFLVDWKEPL
tara:strand:+ start:534 stop:1085 length:552 start_codon:yes stop_codon:yes gene_type:complete